MRKLKHILLIFLTFYNCEEVVELDLKTAEPRLVIDATLTKNKNNLSNVQYIKLSLTAPYYTTTTPPATGAQVSVKDSQNNEYIFTEEGSTGIYKNVNFSPDINATYNLVINYKNNLYTATETMIPVVDIESVEQKNNGGFSGKEIEIKAFYSDPKNIKNFYLFEFINTSNNTISIEVYDDQFTDGNKIFAFYSKENLKVGNNLIIKNHGISKQHYEFMFLLLQQSDDNNSGDPFQTQPSTIRGNCINKTNPNNFPLGYFRISEVSSYNYIIE